MREQRLDPGAPFVDEALRGIAILANELRLDVGRLARRLDRRLGQLFQLAAHVDDRVAEPIELDVLAGDDVLKGVVEVVMGDMLGHRDVPLPHDQLVPVEFAQQREQFGRLHELCFSLQVMQTRVQGMAFSRAAAISSPQSRQMP